MILKPFNLTFLIMLFIIAASIVLIWNIFKNKNQKIKGIFLLGLCAFNIAVFFVYKGFLSVDREFLTVSKIDSFNWFNELPLQLCNINMFIIPIALLTRRRSLLGFAFFVAPLGALMALVFPEQAFSGYSVLLPRIAGFYLTHMLIFVCGVSLSVLGFYKPNYKDFVGITTAFFLLSLSAHVINTLLRVTGVCPFANYFFTYGSDVSILKLFWSWIPKPFFYELPSLLILFSYMAFVSLLYYIPEKISGTRNKNNPNAGSSEIAEKHAVSSNK